MGGCRCYFRQCHVSYAKFPGMHFFRFPLKDPQRYKEWQQYTKMEHMMEFSEVRRRNTSICARHFRIECFMNYKMDRLVPNAVPTIMRLSNSQAIDFELDIENGVLVTLEETKFKHLIPPDGFEDPLYLANDKVLLEKLTELQSQEHCTNTEFASNVEFVDSGKPIEYDEIKNNKERMHTGINSVEILETIQVSAPKTKRTHEIEEDIPVTSTRVYNKQRRILNSNNYNGENDIKGTSIVLSSKSVQFENFSVDSVEADFVRTNQLENNHDLLNNEQLYLTSEAFESCDIEEAENIEFIEIHKDESNLNFEMPSDDSDSTIVQIKTYKVDRLTPENVNQELSQVQSQLLKYKKKCEDFDILQVKLSMLESENNELKKTSKENEEINKKLLRLRLENIFNKKNCKTLKDKLNEFCEENKKLKEVAAEIKVLRAELLSRNEEIKDLKIVLESLKDVQSKEQRFKEQFENIEEERYNAEAKESKLNYELNVLKKTLELTNQQLKDTKSELNAIKTNEISMKNENDRLARHSKELKQTLNRIQTNFEAKQNECKAHKRDYDNLLQKYSLLEQKYWKLEALQNQEATVSTSLENTINNTNHKTTYPAASNSFTRAQLFNGIKRYLSSAMVSLLRMEMFGSSEREWKCDERQVSVDILRLGENVYKYFTDEWRLRLPSIRDVHNWLNQSQQIMVDEEDL